MVLCTWQKKQEKLICWKCGSQECPNRGSSFLCAKSGKDDLPSRERLLWRSSIVKLIELLKAPSPSCLAFFHRCERVKREYAHVHTLLGDTYERLHQVSLQHTAIKKGHTVSNSLFIYMLYFSFSRRPKEIINSVNWRIIWKVPKTQSLLIH